MNFTSTRSAFLCTTSLIFILIFSSCQKNVDKPMAAEESIQPTSYNSQASYSQRGPEDRIKSDGALVKRNYDHKLGEFDWYLQFKDGRWEVPTYLDQLYYRDNLPVEIMYRYSEKTITTTEMTDPKPMIELVYISLVKTVRQTEQGLTLGDEVEIHQ